MNEYKKIENDVTTLSETMMQLNSLVNDRQETIQTIEEFIESSKKDTETAGQMISEGATYNVYNCVGRLLLGGVISIAIVFFL